MARQRKAEVRLVPCEWRVMVRGMEAGAVRHSMPNASLPFLAWHQGSAPQGQWHPTRAAAVAALIAAKENK